jgi:hypothetical protein
MHDWLESLRPAGISYGVVDDASNKPEQTTKRKAREALKQNVAQRVRA